MTQNTSSAVMQQRSEPHDSLDDFPTPPWATRALCEWLQNECDVLINPDAPKHAPTTWPMSCHEPAANRGYMVRALSEYFRTVHASDIQDYGVGFPVRNYLLDAADLLFNEPTFKVDWTITNPPFRLAQSFIVNALARSRVGVAVLVRSAFLEGSTRYRTIFADNPPTHVLQFVERVPMVKGRYDPKASTATAYCWLVWDLAVHGPSRTELHWIAPCRKRLEKEGDEVGKFSSDVTEAACG